MDFISNLRPDPEVLREPRGFMRIVQIVLAIFAFGTISSVRTITHVMVACQIVDNPNITVQQDIEINYGYPFRIKLTADIDLPFCTDREDTKTVSGKFDGNFSSSAEFFCFIGVMSFLILLVLIPAYVFLTPFFAKGSLPAKVDFLVSCAWTVLWFVAAAAWADNLSKMTSYMDPENLISKLETECADRCTPGRAGDHSTLVVSVLFGFLNMGVSGASLWFLFKETDWHKDKSDAEDDPTAYADPGYQTPEYATDPTIPTTPTGGMGGVGMQSSFGSQGGGANDYYSSGQPTY